MSRCVGAGDLSVGKQCGEAQEITDWEGAIGGFAVSPDGNWLAFRGRKKDVDFEQAQKQKLASKS